jgi:hypothetical protein
MRFQQVSRRFNQSCADDIKELFQAGAASPKGV